MLWGIVQPQQFIQCSLTTAGAVQKPSDPWKRWLGILLLQIINSGLNVFKYSLSTQWISVSAAPSWDLTVHAGQGFAWNDHCGK